MREKFESIMSSNMDGLICVERKRDMPNGQSKEATQDMYITELQRESARTQTMFENIREDIKELEVGMKEILAVVNKISADVQIDRKATDMRITKVENDLTTVHARLDDQREEIKRVKEAPGKRTQTALGWVAKAAISASIGGLIVLLTLGLRAWVGG